MQFGHESKKTAFLVMVCRHLEGKINLLIDEAFHNTNPLSFFADN